MKYYSKEHEWVKLDGDDAIVGITGFVAKELGDITYVELPREGADFIVGDSIGIVESVKDSVDVFCPVSGTVKAVNEDLLDAPEAINADPYGAWLVEVEDITDQEELLDAAAYEAHCAQED